MGPDKPWTQLKRRWFQEPKGTPPMVETRESSQRSFQKNSKTLNPRHFGGPM